MPTLPKAALPHRLSLSPLIVFWGGAFFTLVLLGAILLFGVVRDRLVGPSSQTPVGMRCLPPSGSSASLFQGATGDALAWLISRCRVTAVPALLQTVDHVLGAGTTYIGATLVYDERYQLENNSGYAILIGVKTSAPDEAMLASMRLYRLVITNQGAIGIFPADDPEHLQDKPNWLAQLQTETPADAVAFEAALLYLPQATQPSLTPPAAASPQSSLEPATPGPTQATATLTLPPTWPATETHVPASPTPTMTVSAQSHPQATARPSTRATATLAPTLSATATQALAAAPAQAVADYWGLVNRGEFATAWTGLSAGFQQRNHGSQYAHYARGFEQMNLCAVEVVTVRLTEQVGRLANVYGRLEFKTGAACQAGSYDFDFYLFYDAPTQRWLIDKVWQR